MNPIMVDNLGQRHFFQKIQNIDDATMNLFLQKSATFTDGQHFGFNLQGQWFFVIPVLFSMSNTGWTYQNSLFKFKNLFSFIFHPVSWFLFSAPALPGQTDPTRAPSDLETQQKVSWSGDWAKFRRIISTNSPIRLRIFVGSS
jgi:hypothetical protein